MWKNFENVYFTADFSHFGFKVHPEGFCWKPLIIVDAKKKGKMGEIGGICHSITKNSRGSHMNLKSLNLRWKLPTFAPFFGFWKFWKIEFYSRFLSIFVEKSPFKFCFGNIWWYLIQKNVKGRRYGAFFVFSAKTRALLM